MKRFSAWIRISTVIALSLLLISCSSETAEQKQNRDPFEPYNRAAFHFNDAFDHLILKPVAQGYLDVAPKPVTRGVSNFYSNLNMVPTVGNDVLQGNFYQATSDFWRFFINTTAGLLGTFDVASKMGLNPNSEDLGLTFARWGWTKSNYFIIPAMGPSTVRDAIGLYGNYYMTVYPYINNIPLRNTLFGIGIINERANLLELQGVINQAALDPYVFRRNAYFQRRAYLIKRNTELRDPYLEQSEEQVKHEDTTKVHPQSKPLNPKQTNANHRTT